MTPLTPKQKQVFDFINDSLSNKGVPPSLAEIQSLLEAKSVNSAKQIVDQLIEKGYLKTPAEKNQKRALQIPKKVQEELLKREVDEFKIPLAGTVAAGLPIEAIETSDYLEVPRSMLKGNSTYFALKVKGDSMIGDAIADGDFVVIRKQAVARNGQTVVALVDNEATIKRYFKKKDQIELHPANPQYDVIRVKGDAEFKILGVLTGVIRSFE